MSKYSIIGLMSGTSLDGLDIAHCIFENIEGKWSFTLKEATSLSFSNEWKDRLKHAPNLDAKSFWKLHRDYGAFMGSAVKGFIDKHQLNPLFIASHGYTVFHEPSENYTCQIGDGSALTVNAEQNVICDFRTMDVAMGGQGAPLVPIGDRDLFGLSEDLYCVNIGGIANYSYLENGKVKGKDICAANLVLNRLSQVLGEEYDPNGEIARSGHVNSDLLDELNLIQWNGSLEALSIHKKYDSVFEKYNISIKDKLATCVEHIAYQFKQENLSNKQLFFTGGGSFNQYLIERVSDISQAKIIVPDAKIVEFKEAIIFAYLGLKRHLAEENCLSSITGARQNNIGGAIYLYK